MGFRFRRRIGLLPGVTLNVGKSGVSVSAGIKGAKVTFGSKGVRKTVGIPGTGLSYTDYKKFGEDDELPQPRRSALLPVLMLLLVLWLIIHFLTPKP